MLKTFQNFSVTQHIIKGCTGLFEKDWYIRTLLRALQGAIGNANQLLKDLSRLLRKNLSSFMRVSTLFQEAMNELRKKVFKEAIFHLNLMSDEIDSGVHFPIFELAI